MQHALGIQRRHPIIALAALGVALVLTLVSTLSVLANSVTLHDQAGVLNVEKVQSEAAKLSAPMFIYTTKVFQGDQNALNQDVRSHLPSQQAIALGIDTLHRHVSVESGNGVRISDDQASTAISAFSDNFHSGDYTGATIAAIDSLQNSLTGSTSSGGLSMIGLIVALSLGAVVIVVIALIVIITVNKNGRNRPPTGGPPWRGGRPAELQNGAYRPRPVYVPPVTSTYPGASGGSFGGGAGGSFGGGGSSGGGAGGSF